MMVVSFLAGGHRFAVEATQIRALQYAEYPARQYTIEEVLGLPIDVYGEVGFHSTLMIRHHSGDVAVRVMDPVQIVQLSPTSIYPLPSLIATCCQCTSARALALTAQGLTLLVDIHHAINEATHHEV